MRNIYKSHYVKILTRLGMVIGVFFLLSNLCVWTVTGIPWLYSQSVSVKKLTKVLPILKDYHVIQYRNQGWCKVLIYKKGNYWFSIEPSSTTCVLGPEIPYSFPQLALDDFSKLKNRFFWTGMRIRLAYIEYDDLGEILYAEFDLVDLIPHYSRFIYSPLKIPSDKAGDATNYYIEPGWYYQDEDWN